MNSARVYTLLMFLGFLFFPLTSNSQVSDANLWTRLALKYDIGSKTRLALEEEFRFFENVTRLEKYHTEIGIEREIIKRLNLGAYYRYITEDDPERYHSIGHRSWLQFELLILDKDLEISFRNRLQGTMWNIRTSSTGNIPEWYSRYKISLDYKAKDASWIPGGDIEFWQALNPGDKPDIDQLRATLGLEYRYNKHLRWKVFYSYQKELGVANPETDHIWGIAGTYVIN